MCVCVCVCARVCVTNSFSQFHAFLLPVLSALNAFVSRRQQAIHAESVHKNHLNQSVATVSYDLIQLETKVIHHVLTDNSILLLGH